KKRKRKPTRLLSRRRRSHGPRPPKSTNSPTLPAKWTLSIRTTTPDYHEGNPKNQEPNFNLQADLVLGIWFLVLGIGSWNWFLELVLGIWFLEFGSWNLVLGIWQRLFKPFAWRCTMARPISASRTFSERTWDRLWAESLPRHRD